MNKVKIVVAGPRDLDDYGYVHKKLDEILKHISGTIVFVNGGASGVDTSAKKYAESKGYKCVTYLPDWAKYGKSAGPIRNSIMAENADMLIAFTRGDTKGTKNMIRTAKLNRLVVFEIPYGENENE